MRTPPAVFAILSATVEPGYTMSILLCEFAPLDNKHSLKFSRYLIVYIAPSGVLSPSPPLFFRGVCRTPAGAFYLTDASGNVALELTHWSWTGCSTNSSPSGIP
ncbi:hypothetical protein R3P38DRAFT_495044 [Favolaschia claudopus]|uniref:Uncharacterized protein n=1 Tax=Favolaschia claudopus TaxID=2862362 RepID=A0AAW0CM05_9AGAR